MKNQLYTVGVNIPCQLISRGFFAEITYNGATSLVFYLAAGVLPDASTHTEITDSQGNTVTRQTVNGSGKTTVQVNGMEPGLYISLKTISGTGTLSMNLLTSQ